MSNILSETPLTEVKKKSKKGSVQELPFEDRLKRLQEIIALLEKGEISLENSLSLYKEGVEHAKSCQKLIQDAEHEIKILHDQELKDFKIV